jgi:GNAT superfamily N-acetyltransferase
MSAPNPFLYRPLRRSDRESYLEVIVQGIGKLETSTGLGDNAEDMIRTLFGRPLWAVTAIARALGRPIVDIFVASEGEKVTGTGMLLYTRQAAYVAGMATRVEYRGRGIASQILSLLSQEARRRRRPWLALDVESENETAIRIYLKSGYREVERFSWFTRNGPPGPSAPTPDSVPLLTRSDAVAVTAALDAARPEAYRRVFPSSWKTLSHNENFGRGPRTRRRAWVRRGANGSVAVVRAYFLAKRKLGAYFLLCGTPEPTSEELTGVLDAAGAWLSSLGPARAFAVAPESSGAARTALERAGFARVVGSTTMVRETPG